MKILPCGPEGVWEKADCKGRGCSCHPIKHLREEQFGGQGGELFEVGNIKDGAKEPKDTLQL